jgi:hypothetical protein
MCRACGYLVSTGERPGECNGCHASTSFNDVTCYRPDCGGEQNVDPLLIGATLRAIGRQGGPASHAAEEPAASVPDDVQSLPIFRGLSTDQINTVLALGRKETIPSGTAVFHEGDAADRLYVVDSGRVAVNTSLKGGTWAPVCVVSDGGVFGWSCLIPPYTLTASATTLEDTTVTRFDADDLRDLFSRETAIGYLMTQNVGELITSRLKNARLELIGVVFM